MNRNQDIILTRYVRKLIACKARGLVGQAGFRKSDIPDIEQHLRVQLLDALKNFDPEKATVNTFAVRVVDARISNLLRFRIRESRRVPKNIRSLGELVPNADGSGTTLDHTIGRDFRRLPSHRTAEEEIDLRIDVEAVLETLPLDLRRLAELLKHRTLVPAAKELGIPRSTAFDRLRNHILKAFAEAGIEEYL